MATRRCSPYPSPTKGICHQFRERRHSECPARRLARRTYRAVIEAPGFLDDKDDQSTLVRQLSKTELDRRETEVEGRMKRKLLALRRLFESGATEVIIGDGRTEHPVNDALAGKGTRIQLMTTFQELETRRSFEVFPSATSPSSKAKARRYGTATAIATSIAPRGSGSRASVMPTRRWRALWRSRQTDSLPVPVCSITTYGPISSISWSSFHPPARAGVSV